MPSHAPRASACAHAVPAARSRRPPAMPVRSRRTSRWRPCCSPRWCGRRPPEAGSTPPPDRSEWPDEDRAAVRVNRQAERRKGHGFDRDQTATCSSIVALPSQRGSSGHGSLHLPATEALRLRHARAEGRPRDRSGAGVSAAPPRTRGEPAPAIRVTIATRAPLGTTTTSPSAASMTRPLAAGRGCAWALATGHCGQEREGDRHEPSAGHVHLPEEQRRGWLPCGLHLATLEGGTVGAQVVAACREPVSCWSS